MSQPIYVYNERSTKGDRQDASLKAIYFCYRIK